MPTSLRSSWIRPLTALAAATLVLTALPSSAAAAELPAPGLSRSASPDGALTVGRPVDIDLTARNIGAGVAFDPWVVECVAAGLTVSAISPAATVTPAGCADGATRIDWKLDDLAPGASTPLRYTALPQSVTVAGTMFATRGRISVLSAPFDRAEADSTVPEGITVRTIQSSRSLTYGLPTVTQTTTPSNPVPGETVTVTLVSTVPAGVGLANAVVRDLMPVGMDLDRLQTIGVSCVDSGGTPCTLHDTAGEHHVNHQRLVTWTLGHLSPAPTDRVITVVLSIPVQTDGDAVLRNRSGMQWSDHPSIVGRAGFRGGVTATGTITVVDPNGPGTVPSGTVPSDSVPSGTVPSDSVPSDSVPSDSVPSGTVPSGTVPTVTAPSPTPSGTGPVPSATATRTGGSATDQGPSGPGGDGPPATTPSAGGPGTVPTGGSPAGATAATSAVVAGLGGGSGLGGSDGPGTGSAGGSAGRHDPLATTGADVAAGVTVGFGLLLAGGALAAVRLRSSRRATG